jgi:excisionase family DNA binding protein
MDDQYNLLTMRAAAKMLGLSHHTVSAWVDMGLLPTVPMPGSDRKRIRRQTLIDFIDRLEKKEREVPAKLGS